MLYLSRYIQEMEPRVKEPLLARFSSARKKLRRDGVIDALEEAESDTAANEAAELYFRQGIECPFLEDDACSIHRVRPFACREFNALSEPWLCRDPFRNKIRRMPVAPKLTTVMARFAGRVLGEKPVLLPHILLTDKNSIIPQWYSAFPGISLFEKLLESFQ
jgi:hypothetical protein